MEVPGLADHADRLAPCAPSSAARPGSLAALRPGPAGHAERREAWRACSVRRRRRRRRRRSGWRRASRPRHSRCRAGPAPARWRALSATREIDALGLRAVAQRGVEQVDRARPWSSPASRSCPGAVLEHDAHRPSVRRGCGRLRRSSSPCAASLRRSIRSSMTAMSSARRLLGVAAGTTRRVLLEHAEQAPAIQQFALQLRAFCAGSVALLERRRQPVDMADRHAAC